VTWKQLAIAGAILAVLLPIAILESPRPIPCEKQIKEAAYYMHGGAQAPQCKVAAEPRTAVK
jgi:hypothetical protein